MASISLSAPGAHAIFDTSQASSSHSQPILPDPAGRTIAVVPDAVFHRGGCCGIPRSVRETPGVRLVRLRSGDGRPVLLSLLHVGANPFFLTVVNGTYFEINGFQAAEGPFNNRELLVSGYYLLRVDDSGRHIGANHIEAVQCRLISDLRFLALIAECVIANDKPEMLADLVLVDHFSRAQSNFLLVAQWTFLPGIAGEAT